MEEMIKCRDNIKLSPPLSFGRIMAAFPCNAGGHSLRLIPNNINRLTAKGANQPSSTLPVVIRTTATLAKKHFLFLLEKRRGLKILPGDEVSGVFNFTFHIRSVRCQRTPQNPWLVQAGPSKYPLNLGYDVGP